jgi:hypothetical protein
LIHFKLGIKIDAYTKEITALNFSPCSGHESEYLSSAKPFVLLPVIGFMPLIDGKIAANPL